MKIWIILEAEDTDYSTRFGFSKVVGYKLSEKEAEEQVRELNNNDAFRWFYCTELEINMSDFLPTGS